MGRHHLGRLIPWWEMESTKESSPKLLGKFLTILKRYSVFNLPTIYWIFKKMLWSNRLLSNVVSIHFLFKQLRESDAMYSSQDILLLFEIVVAELTERSPIIIQNGSSNPSSRGFSPGQGKALCPWDMWGKKKRAPLLGLAKFIYYINHLFSGWCTYWEIQTKLFLINKTPVTVAYWIWLWN